MSDILDLDALAPEPRTIKLGGKEIQVQPPRTRHVLRLGFLGQKMQDLDSMSVEESDELIEKLEAEIKQCIPEIEKHTLNASQLMQLLSIIVDMGMPNQAEVLKEKGITVDNTSKDPLA